MFGHTNRVRKTVLVIGLFAWMAFIFIMSAEPADDSTEMSLNVGMAVGRIFVPGFSSLDMEEQLEFAEKIDHPVRKTAHAAEYAVLGVLMDAAVYNGDEKRKKAAAVSIVLCACYAVSDEVHQIFVPGRSCQATDVLIDTCGALAGILICALIEYGRTGKQNKNRESSV